jgi:4-hydroxybenzoate polyprenyltransferase
MTVQVPDSSSPSFVVGLLGKTQPLLAALRPRQWIKNGLVFVAFAFSIGDVWQLQDVSSWVQLLVRSGIAAIAFCAVSSAGYLINDLHDTERDRLHPKKRHRPLASGALGKQAAVITAVALVVFGFLLSLTLGWQDATVLAGYMGLTYSYSAFLKHIPIIDLIALSFGFVLRVVAGGIATNVPISPWLYLCTLLGALFVVMTKRRQEIVTLQDDASAHRPILLTYSVELLNQLVSVVTPSVVITYALYTVTAPNAPQNGAMVATVPFVLYGVFRYIYLVHLHQSGGSPEEVLLQDRPLRLTVILWFASSIAILAVFRH